MGTVPISEALAERYLAPLFASSCPGDRIYLATHSLGLPPDAAAEDLAAYLATWFSRGALAWPEWLAAREHYRASLATLLGAPRTDCVIPRESAGEALASVLAMLPAGARVVTSSGEFDSVLTVLGQHAAHGRIRLAVLGEAEMMVAAAIARELEREPTALVVLSHVFYATGRLLPNPAEFAAICRAHGAALLLDVYHSLGAVPVDAGALGCDYMIGGCYKYLRGGPGAAFLYAAPDRLEHDRPLQTGWFALRQDAHVEAGAPPQLAPGGDAHLLGTPAVAAWFQARAGLELALALGPDRLRAWSLDQLRFLKAELAAQGIDSRGADSEHGAFLTIPVQEPDQVVAALAEHAIVANARRGLLRLTPDLVTTRDQLARTARVLRGILAE